MKRINPTIVKYLADKLGLKPSTVEKEIYLLQKSYPNLTKNALAQIYATKNRVSVFRKLDKEDKATLPSTEVVPEKISLKAKKTNREKVSIRALFEYDTKDHFKSGHINELNKAYTYRCFTAVFVLLRKIIENLIIDILRAKYPDSKREDKELYFDITHGRFNDFDVILRNLYERRNDFGAENKAVERLYALARGLKSDANDKAHSWYHLVESESEVENLNVVQIIELIKRLELVVGLR